MMILRLTTLALLVGLTGCSVFSADNSSKAAPGTALRECEDAAEADTSLNKYAAENASATPGAANSYDNILDHLRQKSVDSCLQRRGTLPRGGVERLKG